MTGNANRKPYFFEFDKKVNRKEGELDIDSE